MGVDITAIVIACVMMIAVSAVASVKPNVVFIVADDLGWNDVSFHGSDQIPTPNIDSLALSGVALTRYYTHCQCSPSRAAILTGKYAHKTGMQGYPLTNGEDRGLPLTEKILPEYLKELGYSTHLVGKWHQGHSRLAYLPTFRGFDTHYGHRGGYLDYYEYTKEEEWVTGKVSGLDLYRNLTADWAAEGYVTDLYTEEAKNIISRHDPSSPLFLMVSHNAPHSGNEGALLQAAPEDVRAMRHVESPERRIFGAMVKKLDESIGDIVEALNDKQLLNNTIIVFISDNGAPTLGKPLNYGSNYPLRGNKMTAWDGALRAVGLVWSLNENFKKNVWDGYIHASDWVPTILAAIGGLPNEGIDGKNLWTNIMESRKSDRDEIYEIDDYTGFGAIIAGDYKLVIGEAKQEWGVHSGADLQGVIGTPPIYKDALSKSKTYHVLGKWGKEFDLNGVNVNDSKIHCENKEFDGCVTSKDKWCLYNILEDPCEKEDLSAKYPEIGAAMLAKYRLEESTRIPRQVPLIRDPRAAPKLFNYTWTSFIDLSDSRSS